MSVDKRENERSILRTVYSVSEFDNVSESERPDFMLSRRADSPAFGVEVTEVFAHEADARAVNHPMYLADLFEGGEYMHGADRKLLQIARFRITDADGMVTHEDLPGIFSPLPTDAEHRRRIGEVIRIKASRGYSVDGTHINLVIRDRFRLAGEVIEEEYSVTDLLSAGVREALLESTFREVFLISISRSGEQVYRPLQQLLLAEQFFLFGKALEVAPGRPDMGEQWKYVQAFADFAERRGMPVTLHEDGMLPVAAYRSSAVGLDSQWGLNLLDLSDHADSQLPAWKWRPVLAPLTDDEFERYAAFVDGNGFYWGYYAPAKEVAVLPQPHTRTVFLTEVPDNSGA